MSERAGDRVGEWVGERNKANPDRTLTLKAGGSQPGKSDLRICFVAACVC